jgi:soluble lytic murein transglycosylase-like protein
MNKLHIGARSRRKEVRKRFLRRAAVVSLLAMALGIPGADAGLGLLRSLTGEGVLPLQVAGGIESSESAASSLRFMRRNFALRPSPTPDPGSTPELSEPSGSIPATIYAAAAASGLDGAYLLSVAQCESGLDPHAVNPAGYYGLFQFDERTWAAYGSGSIYDPVAQATTAAELIAAGGASRWPNCA